MHFILVPIFYKVVYDISSVNEVTLKNIEKKSTELKHYKHSKLPILRKIVEMWRKGLIKGISNFVIYMIRISLCNVICEFYGIIDVTGTMVI